LLLAGAALLPVAVGCTVPADPPEPAGAAPVAETSAVCASPADAPSATLSSTPATAPAEDPLPALAGARTAAPTGPRIYAKARFAWIQPEARASHGWIGYLSLGGSVALRGGSVEAARVVGGPGCDAWYAVEPRGYVCADSTATVDPTDPAVVALVADAARTDSPWPYEYAESTGTPRYAHIPSPAEQRQTEWGLDAHLAQVERARHAASPDDVDKDLAGVDLTPSGVPVPDLLAVSPLVRESRNWVAPGSTVAYTRGFDAAGRTFLMTADHAFVPKDRVRPYPRRQFQGVELGESVSLPLAFFRKKPRPQYRRGEDGAFTATGETWPVHSWVALSGESEESGGHRFLATREAGLFVLEADASVVHQASVAPFSRARSASDGRRTWLDVSVLDGTLVAYEDLKPVFATLISPGRGGVPYDGRDPLETASTPTGTFRVDGKFVTATMVSSTNELIVHTEVMFVQNFHGPHALHGAYWHDGWGEPKSGGCVNLSPIDAKHLFEWSDPRLPEGWHGLRSTADAGPSTVVVVHR
jgi:hypothetical protein